jgi:hypothetical protein
MSDLSQTLKFSQKLTIGYVVFMKIGDRKLQGVIMWPLATGLNQDER